mgnify:CR=1 FL=1
MPQVRRIRARIQPAATDLRHPSGVAGNAVPMHLREFGIGSQILRQLGVHKLRLLTNSKTDMPGLEAFGLQIVERVPIEHE